MAGERILVVDDEKSMCQFLSIMLRKEGYDITTVSTGKKAVEEVSASKFDVVLTDIKMAGMDGILNKIHPGEAMDKNLYDLPPAELAEVPTVAGSLREALDSLEADHDFLLKGDVFSKDQIEAYVEIKRAEVARWEMTPSPVEYDMYYSG